MARLLFSALVFVIVALAEGQHHKPKKVKCQDRRFTDCYHKDLYCPDDCLRTCVADCASCQPVCVPPPPPPPTPPPPPPKQHKVKCREAGYKRTCSKDLYCPLDCPKKCFVDCAACQTTCVPPPPPPPPESSGGRSVRCRNRSYPSCYYSEHRCPDACPDNCEVDCVTCSPVCNCNRPGAVCQDPRFVGADGITFYFHGKKGREFCIVSDTNLHINAHFIGRRNENMQRDFTWVQSLGILFDNHRIFIGAKTTAAWDDKVDHVELAYDGEHVLLPEEEGAKWNPSSRIPITITRSRDTNAVVVEVEGNFRIKAAVVPITWKDSTIHKYGITEEDCFAHLDLGFRFYSLSDRVTGVLGQTYASNYVSRVKMGVDMPVLGGEKEFSSSAIFSTDCAVSRFNGTKTTSLNKLQHANMNCDGGLDGRGVVCKR